VFYFTKTAVGNLLRRYSTRLYPAEVREPFQDARGELINEIDKCIFCLKCARACPSQCITVDNKAATWACDPFVCIYCGVCVDICPTNSLHMLPAYRKAGYEREMILQKGEIKKKAASSGKKGGAEEAVR